MKNLPIGIQSFEKLRKGDYLYVDKTRMVYDLTHSGGTYFFLSRPRRFGKSLLLSTLKAYFEGKRDLFEGLDIMELEHDWKQHPVLHLDLNTGDYTSVEGLWGMFRRHIINWEQQFNIKPTIDSLPERFVNIIMSMNDVVILVDEYDKPLLQDIDSDLRESFFRILSTMFGVFKTCNAHIDFAMITGVTYTNVLESMNLYDTTLADNTATICGFTDEEVRSVFAEHIAEMAAEKGMAESDFYDQFKAICSGYRFSLKMDDVFNPYTVINTFANNELQPYWYQSVTDDLIFKEFKKARVDTSILSKELLLSSNLNRIATNDIITWLFQTGYLTIKEYDRELCLYSLGFPNREVEEGLMKSFIPQFNTEKRNIDEWHIKTDIL